MTRRVLVAVMALALGAHPALTSSPVWKPHETSVLVVSLVRWPARAELAPFDTSARQDLALVAALRKRGVPPSRLRSLRDGQATRERVRRALADVCATGAAGDTLIVYLQAHGLKDEGAVHLATWDVDQDRAAGTGFPLSELSRTIARRWRGDTVLLFGDFCYSGALADAARALSATGRMRAAALAASTGTDRSTGRWTFSEALVQAFTGHALCDGDRDGAITVGDLAARIRQVMKHREEQLAGVELDARAPVDLVLASVNAATRPRRAAGPWQVGDGVEARDREDVWYPAEILEVDGARYRVRFAGWDADSDEWLPADRIRRLPATTFRPGDRVRVDAGDEKPREASVLAVREGTFCFVHYAGEDASEDEWVPVRRLSPAGSATAARSR